MNWDTPELVPSSLRRDGIYLKACMFSESLIWSLRPIASIQGLLISSNRESTSSRRPSTSCFVPPTSYTLTNSALPMSVCIESYIVLRSSNSLRS